MSEPNLVALAIMLLAACDAVSAASSPASRILRRAAGLALIAAAGGEAGGEHFLAHRRLGELVDRAVFLSRPI